MSINRVVLVGNVSNDPELRRTASGTCVLSFSIAVDERRKNAQTGKWESHANFFDCTMLGSRAEALSDYIFKGAKVGIDGKLRQRSWEKDGCKRYKVDVLADDLELLSSRGKPKLDEGSAGSTGSVKQECVK